MSDTYRYVSLEQVPITGPDPYSEKEKSAAIEGANGRLEADINDGNEISNPEAIHAHAANAYATYILSLGPKAPDNVTMGDLSDEGSRRMNFSQAVYQMYLDSVESIVGSGADEGGGEWPVSVWTSRDY